MKPQDIVFIIVLAFLLWQRKPHWLTGAGLLCFLLAIPLFAAHVFFTAERLIYYAFFLLLASVLIYLFNLALSQLKLKF